MKVKKVNECLSKFERTEKQKQANSLIGSHKYTLLYGGSRSGKTAECIDVLVRRAMKTKSRHAILRFHFNDVKRSIGMDTLPKVLELYDCPYNLNRGDWVFRLGNGSEIWLGGLDDKQRVEKVLGNEYSTIYINEASQISYHAYTTALTRLAENSGLNNKMLIDCNPPEKTHWLYQMFILGKQPDTDMPLSKPELYGFMMMNPTDNPYLSPDYVRDVLSTLPERQKRRFLYGEWLDKKSGSLWYMDLIDKHRVADYPDFMAHCVVGIDPAVTSGEESDETGMVVVGMDIRGHYYVVNDLSGKYPPIEWARMAVNEYHKQMADCVVAETNQGGDMIEGLIRNVDSNVHYEGVRAKRGKVLRAEPVEALYEEGRVHHIGYFPELEEEMCEWSAEESQYSPDRLDALVWGITYLSERYPSGRAMIPSSSVSGSSRITPPRFNSSWGGISVRQAPPSFRR